METVLSLLRTCTRRNVRNLRFPGRRPKIRTSGTPALYRELSKSCYGLYLACLRLLIASVIGLRYYVSDGSAYEATIFPGRLINAQTVSIRTKIETRLSLIPRVIPFSVISSTTDRPTDRPPCIIVFPGILIIISQIAWDDTCRANLYHRLANIT